MVPLFILFSPFSLEFFNGIWSELTILPRRPNRATISIINRIVPNLADRITESAEVEVEKGEGVRRKEETELFSNGLVCSSGVRIRRHRRHRDPNISIRDGKRSITARR